MERRTEISSPSRIALSATLLRSREGMENSLVSYPLSVTKNTSTERTCRFSKTTLPEQPVAEEDRMLGSITGQKESGMESHFSLHVNSR